MVSNILAGVAASFVFFLLGIIWKSHISQWLKGLRYSGLNVSGRWVVQEDRLTAKGYELTVPTQLTVNLNQIADYLSGEAVAEINTNGEKEYINYNVSGKIKDRFVYLVLSLKENRRISHMSFLLEVYGNGEIMEGYMSFYAMRAREMNAVRTEWKFRK
jgi:hypothetical protein